MGAEKKAPVIFPREAVLTVEQVAEALQCDVASVGRMDIPVCYPRPRIKRYVWGQVLDNLMRKAV